MNDLQIFNSPKFGEIRVIIKNGEAWFVANDACRILEISNPRDALARLDDDEKGVVSTDTLGGKQELNAVNEPGLYSLVLGSRKPEAKEFKRWLTHEVIPTIRKTGSYGSTYVLIPKNYKGETVLTTADTAALLGTSREVISQTINQPLAKCREGKDYILLQNEELVEFKKDNPSISNLASSVLAIMKSGFNKICKYLKIVGIDFPVLANKIQQTTLTISASTETTKVPVSSLKSKEKEVTNVPENGAMQEWINNIKIKVQAFNEILILYNRYNSLENHKSLENVMRSMAAEVFATTCAIREIDYEIIKKKYINV